jgi:hypothetical protein
MASREREVIRRSLGRQAAFLPPPGEVLREVRTGDGIGGMQGGEGGVTLTEVAAKLVDDGVEFKVMAAIDVDEERAPEIGRGLRLSEHGGIITEN